jgi:hypothetical protein
MTVVVELGNVGDQWYWRAVLRGPFSDREEADSDACDTAPDLIAALAAFEATTTGK